MKTKYLIGFMLFTIFFISISYVCAENYDTNLTQASEQDISLEKINEVKDNDKNQENSNDNTLISADKNKTELKETYYYDVDQDDVCYDNSLKIVSKNVKMYYKDGTEFKVKVLNENGKPEKRLLVYFIIDDKSYKKVYTDSKGFASISLKYNIGKHNIYTSIAEGDGKGNSGSFWFTYNKITIKSTIPTKALSKSINQKNKEFKIKFLNKKGKILKNKKVKIKVKSKT